ncbi:unnamed protein product [Candidula unifasciata]|uniref:CDP-diacylglycerol--glycerol-3-phosphate 3-phosphatidyltransferase n=1 Tax=Candidula unifasciata TaxID=100452 RepID=A0A8S4AA28_9EUPU|nr:unnamed protein product [Candidula unifasciata]
MAAALGIRTELCHILRPSITQMRLLNQRCFCNKPPARDAAHKRTNRSTRHGQPGVVPDNRLNTFDWLSQYGPRFVIQGEQVQVITEPTQFYEVLKLKSRKAKKRITLASLYLGSGDLEKDLVACVREACLAAVVSGNSDFQVNILLDYTRGSRGTVNSRSMLRPLLAEFRNVSVSLFHTPDLRGLLKKLIPDRFNETIGLTHVKVYLFDDSFIISGANLSADYFTNRQDRYILFNNCSQLADFFHDFVKAIMSFSLSLAPDNSLRLAPDWNIHPYKDSSLKFKMAAREKIESCLRIGEAVHSKKSPADLQNSESGGKSFTDEPLSNSQPGDTAVYPLVQMGPFGVTHDEQMLLCLLRSSDAHDHILLASGYFNLTDYYMSVILNQSLAKFSILMASPQANGFLGAKGVAGAIPYSYIYLAHQFLKQVQKTHQNQRIHLLEYVRDSWTFHGKGLWYYLPSRHFPTLTLVGSPNFGYRSVYRDLECQVAVVTEHKGLQEQLREEHVRMFSSSQPVTEQTFHRRDRYVPLWVRVVTSVIKHFF